LCRKRQPTQHAISKCALKGEKHSRRSFAFLKQSNTDNNAPPSDGIPCEQRKIQAIAAALGFQPSVEVAALVQGFASDSARSAVSAQSCLLVAAAEYTAFQSYSDAFPGLVAVADAFVAKVKGR